MTRIGESRANLARILFQLIVVLCASIGLDARAESSEVRSPNSVFLEIGKHRPARESLKSWSLEEKVGQLVMIGFRSFEQLKKIKPGGVILFSWSMKSVDATRELTDQIKALARADLKSPLFIATDHEGGKVLRLRKGLTPFPDAAAVGQADDQTAFRVGKSMGHELSALGINMNLAPVLDLGNARSFLENRVWGDSGSPVGQLTTAFIRGILSARVLAVAKHFPGHGGTLQDSHFALPIIEKPFDRVWKEDLLPFRDAIDDGVPAVMTAHVEIPAVARGPASLSHEFVTDILRKKMGFNGLVLTDDLEMGGITQKLGAPVEDLALRALTAGTDMIMVVWSEAMQEKIVARVMRAVRNGEVSEDWLDEKVLHIQGMKNRFLTQDKNFENPFWKENLRRPESLALAKEISKEAVDWLAGQKAQILGDLRSEWGRKWTVLVPSVGFRRFWGHFRSQDLTTVMARRPEIRQVEEVKRAIRNAISRMQPLIVVTGPRASSSEEIFKAVEKEFAEAMKKRSIKSPVLWVHQGAKPVDLNWEADKLQIGIVSLYSSSYESLNAFASYLKRETGQVTQVMRE